MLNNLVSIGNVMAGRMISGLVALSMDHPFVLACILAGLMGATVAAMLDAFGPLHAPVDSAVAPKLRPHSSATSGSAACAAGQPAKAPQRLSAEP